MPFEIIKTIKTGPRDGRASISYMQMQTEKAREGKSHQLPHLTVGLPESLIGGWTGDDNTKYVFVLGTDDDAGKAQIRPSKNGDGVKPKLLKGGASFRFGYAETFGRDNHVKEFVLAELVEDGDVIQFNCPEWMAQFA